MLSIACWTTNHYEVMFLDSQGLLGTRVFYSEDDVLSFISDNRKTCSSFRVLKQSFAEFDYD